MDFQDIQIKELSIKTGISKNTLDKYLFGKKVQPGVENAVKIANALGVSVEYLVLGNSDIVGKNNTQSYENNDILEKYLKLNKYNRKTIEILLNSLLERQ